MDTHEVQKSIIEPQAKNRCTTFKHRSEIAIFNILHRLLFILKSPAIPLSIYGPHNAMQSSLPHYPVMVMSNNPSPNSQQINYIALHYSRYPKSLNAKDHSSLAIVKCNSQCSTSLTHYTSINNHWLPFNKLLKTKTKTKQKTLLSNKFRFQNCYPNKKSYLKWNLAAPNTFPREYRKRCTSQT